MLKQFDYVWLMHYTIYTVFPGFRMISFGRCKEAQILQADLHLLYAFSMPGFSDSLACRVRDENASHPDKSCHEQNAAPAILVGLPKKMGMPQIYWLYNP